jgi:PRC-barrel domain
MRTIAPSEGRSAIGAGGLALVLALTSGLAGADGSAVAPMLLSQSTTPSLSENQPATPPSPAPHHVLEPLTPELAMGILGAKVRGPAGEAMGLVVDVVFGRDGAPYALVIDFGGFLGVGTRKIAIDWSLVHFEPLEKDAPVEVEVSREDLQSAPEYNPTAPSKMIGPEVLGHPAPADTSN